MLWVIEGLDASGKSTQCKLLTNKLQEMGKPCRFVHFPRYQQEPFGQAVAMFLRGDFGNNQEELNPYFISLLFACDQWQGQNLLDSRDEIVLLDRYYYSNMAYQSARVTNPAKQTAFMAWLDKVFTSFSMLQPDIALYLDVPEPFRKANLACKRHGDDRNYLKGEPDIYEEDFVFQNRVEQQYLQLCQRYSELHLLKCYNATGMDTPEDITNRILSIIKEKGLL